MISPIRGGVLGRRHNRTLHGRSVHRKTDVPGHNVILGYARPGVGDALDVFVTAGEPVLAMHGGRISRVADRGGRLSCVYVAGGGMTSVYAHVHVKESLALGSKVVEGQVIGWVDRKLSDPHLHLELWKGGRSISAKSPEDLAREIERIIGGK